VIHIRVRDTLLVTDVIKVLPVSVIAFFLGLEIIGVISHDFLLRLDPNQIFGPYIDGNSLFGISLLLSWFYTWNIGLILIFFPFGVIIIFYQLTISVRDFKDRNNSIEKNQHLIQKYYLILFFVPFAFLLPATFYSILIFFPLLIIFSVYGIIYIKDFISTYSETLSWLLLVVLLFISIIYTFIKVEVGTKIDLWYVFVFSFISLILFLFVLVINKYKNLKKLYINSIKKCEQYESKFN